MDTVPCSCLSPPSQITVPEVLDGAKLGELILERLKARVAAEKLSPPHLHVVCVAMFHWVCQGDPITKAFMGGLRMFRGPRSSLV